VWNLFAIGEQIMRAADCKKLAESPEGVFRQAQGPVLAYRALFLLIMRIVLFLFSDKERTLPH